MFPHILGATALNISLDALIFTKQLSAEDTDDRQPKWVKSAFKFGKSLITSDNLNHAGRWKHSRVEALVTARRILSFLA